MAYISLYRKYRSQTFEEVMGQQHVTKTLQNAIKSGKVAHAYLFCGTRGTGKTTTARIFAKAMNCAEGPTPTPCNKCFACTSITAGAAMDVVEMDAASHTSIDDIEEIRENVKFPPMELRYKVFIIDEVHQLSKSAKDAFLKTLEEPPAHTIFILATTEPQSIPVTIKSRCQQFEFRRGSLKDIRDRLKFVADREGVQVDDAALDLIAMNADGSYRDSLSVMEQVLAYTDGHVSAEDVNAVLGVVNQEFIVKLADIIADGNEARAFEAVSEVVESGRDIPQVIRSMAQHFRNLLFASVTKNPQEIAAGEQMIRSLMAQADRFTEQNLLRTIEVFTETEKDIRYNEQHRLLLELALLKAISIAKHIESAPSKPRQEKNKREIIPAKSENMQVVSQNLLSDKGDEITKVEGKQTSSLISNDSPGNDEVALPDFDTLSAKWNQVMQHLRTISNPAYAFLTNAKPVAVRDGSIVLAFSSEGLRNIFINEKQRGKTVTKKQAVIMAIHRVFGVANANIICEVYVPPDLGNDNVNVGISDNERTEQPDNIEDEDDNTLSDIIDLFGGEIVD